MQSFTCFYSLHSRLESETLFRHSANRLPLQEASDKRTAKVVLEEWYSRSRRPRTQMQQFILSKWSELCKTCRVNRTRWIWNEEVSASRGGMQKLLNRRKPWSLLHSLLSPSVSAILSRFPRLCWRTSRAALLSLLQPIGKWSTSIK